MKNGTKNAQELDVIRLFQPGSREEPQEAGGKLQLKLRTMAIEDELKGIPRTIVQLHQELLLLRQRRFEASYCGARALIKALQLDRNFYTNFGCRALDDYLVKYGIGSGEGLAKLINLVKLFEQETFALVGDDLLNEMIRHLTTAHEDRDGVSTPAQRRRDIQRIFDRYCERYPGFDRERFRQTLREYIREQYPPKPMPPPTPGPDRTTRQPPNQPPVGSRRFVPSDRSRASFADDSGGQESRTKMTERTCSGCGWRDTVISDGEIYIFHLVALIKHLKGRHLLDAIPVPAQWAAYRRKFGIKAP